MENEIIIIQDNKNYTGKELLDQAKASENIHNAIKNSFESVSKKFLELGYFLDRANEKQSYLDYGFDNLYDYTKVCFSIGKTTTKNFINLFKKFALVNYCGDSYCNLKLKDEYKDYSYSQLVELLPVPEDELEKYTSSMTVAEIRSNKKMKIAEDTINDELYNFNQSDTFKKLLEIIKHYSYVVDQSTAYRFVNVKDEYDEKKKIYKYTFDIVSNILDKDNPFSINTLDQKLILCFNYFYSYFIDLSFTKFSVYSWSKSYSLDNINNLFEEKEDLQNGLYDYFDGQLDKLFKSLNDQNDKDVKKNKENELDKKYNKYLKKFITFDELQLFYKLNDDNEIIFKTIEKLSDYLPEKCVYVDCSKCSNICVPNICIRLNDRFVFSFMYGDVNIYEFDSEKEIFNEYHDVDLYELFLHFIDISNSRMYEFLVSQTSDQEDD